MNNSASHAHFEELPSKNVRWSHLEAESLLLLGLWQIVDPLSNHTMLKKSGESAVIVLELFIAVHHMYL
jgi:hypothetical protein